MMTKNPIPRVAAVHDLSGFGRASLGIVFPVLSTMGAQVCPLPTALLSTQTSGYDDYTFHDLTGEMSRMLDHWERIGLTFEAIYTGFLGSVEQIRIVQRLIDDFKSEHAFVLVDPVMGDDGELYGPFDHTIVTGMQQLIRKADVITPNYTEAALLLDEPYSQEIDVQTIKQWLKRLSAFGPEHVIITSVPVIGKQMISSVYAYNRQDDRFWKVECAYIPATYPGTGDIFSSVVVGSMLQQESLPIALDRAIQFVMQAIRATFGHGMPQREGVLLERVLDSLRHSVPMSTYELVD
jgi:pyridoxine kinase